MDGAKELQADVVILGTGYLVKSELLVMFYLFLLGFIWFYGVFSRVFNGFSMLFW